jgi:D-tyrosyl-tRNA(Tyr) deacylase
MATMNKKSESILNEIVKESGEKKTVILERALMKEKRALRIQKLNKYYAELRDDENSWKEELDERKILDNTLTDKLDKLDD